MHALKKIARDLWISRGRTLTILLVITVALIGLNAVLGAYGILSREITRNYTESLPASATLKLERVTRETLDAVRQRPQLAAVTRRKTVRARYRRDEASPWQRAQVFVLDDFEQKDVARLFFERGQRVPPLGTALVERSALASLDAAIGETFLLRLPGGEARSIPISGVVHEPALAPAKTEQALYAYVTRETLRSLGDQAEFDELRVRVRDHSGDVAAIEDVAGELAAWLQRERQTTVHAVRVPPPFAHPHQASMNAVLGLLLIFSALIVVMASLVAASLITTVMARQLREIGVMKGIGARTWQIAAPYAVAMVVLAAVAVLLAWVPGKLAAHAWALSVARLLNFDIENPTQPAWVTFTLIGVGLSLPLLVSAPALWRGSRITARAALDDHGVNRTAFGTTRLDRWLTRFSSSHHTLVYSARNVLRRRRQLLLSLALLSAAGGIFVSAVSSADSWGLVTRQIHDERHYDLEAVLAPGADADPFVQRLNMESDIDAVEVWKSVPVARKVDPFRFPVQHTYPDDTHGALHLVAPPHHARMLDVSLDAGRWLQPDDTNAVVVNQLVPGYDHLRLGQTLSLVAEGQTRQFVVVGKLPQVGVGATVYVSRNTFDELALAHASSTLWVDIARAEDPMTGSGTIPPHITRDIERIAVVTGAKLVSLTPLAVFENAMVAHFELLIAALLGLAALTGGVGALGLASALSVSVTERTREFGVLRALGAETSRIRRAVLFEGLLVGALSIVGTLLASVGLSLAIGHIVGQLSFRLPLPFTLNASAFAVWIVAALGLGAFASWAAAVRAARPRVRDALSAT